MSLFLCLMLQRLPWEQERLNPAPVLSSAATQGTPKQGCRQEARVSSKLCSGSWWFRQGWKWFTVTAASKKYTSTIFPFLLQQCSVINLLRCFNLVLNITDTTSKEGVNMCHGNEWIGHPSDSSDMKVGRSHRAKSAAVGLQGKRFSMSCISLYVSLGTSHLLRKLTPGAKCINLKNYFYVSHFTPCFVLAGKFMRGAASPETCWCHGKQLLAVT